MIALDIDQPDIALLAQESVICEGLPHPLTDRLGPGNAGEIGNPDHCIGREQGTRRIGIAPVDRVAIESDEAADLAFGFKPVEQSLAHFGSAKAMTVLPTGPGSAGWPPAAITTNCRPLLADR